MKRFSASAAAFAGKPSWDLSGSNTAITSTRARTIPSAPFTSRLASPSDPSCSSFTLTIYARCPHAYLGRMSNGFSVAEHWAADFDEAALRQWAGKLRQQLRQPEVNLALVFISPKFFDQAK